MKQHRVRKEMENISLNTWELIMKNFRGSVQKCLNKQELHLNLQLYTFSINKSFLIMSRVDYHTKPNIWRIFRREGLDFQWIFTTLIDKKLFISSETISFQLIWINQTILLYFICCQYFFIVEVTFVRYWNIILSLRLAEIFRENLELPTLAWIHPEKCFR